MITAEHLRGLIRLREPAIEGVERRIEPQEGYVLEHLRLQLAGKGSVRGLLTRPERSTQPCPAILYCHSHGGRYDIGADELIGGREYLLEPLGPVFAAQGHVTLCIDMPVFGERATEAESAASKRLLWYGRSLFGEMLSDQAAALTYLSSREDVDSARIGAFGMSMGCTLSYWLAAMDPRIAAVAHHCCYCDFSALIKAGGHDGHGIYLMVPGLLEQTSTGEIAGLVAPRPQHISVGESDPLTPIDAVDRAYREARAAYAALGAEARLSLLSEPHTAHQETVRMRQSMLAFFRQHLG